MEHIINANRVIVTNDYETAELNNMERHMMGDVKCGAEYIYDNQKTDAMNILNIFYNTEIKVVSVLKRTKLGMDGLMIEISKQFATHANNDFALHRDNIFIITGMSNVLWEKDMKDKMPHCFKNNVYHHGKLERLKKKLLNIKNAVIIVDEIDTGDKKYQKLDSILKGCGVLDLQYMKDNNIRFVFVSATSINQIRELENWGPENHKIYSMTVPDNYVSHKDFLDRDIIKEFYPVSNSENCGFWIKNDIIDNYGSDYRIHIIRVDDDVSKILKVICLENGIEFKNHSCDERIDSEELNDIFSRELSNHIVIAIKGFYRRANYIPNEWKIKIGATHERFTSKPDTSVQIQGLPGRMTGYWRSIIEGGHKTGPYRTSINSIEEYEMFYNNPTDLTISYSTKKKSTFVSKYHIKNLIENDNKRVPIMVECSEKIMNIKKKGELTEYIKELIENQPDKANLLNFISDKNNKLLSVLKPKNIKQNKIYNTDIIDSYERNVPYLTEIDSEKTQNKFQVYIDIIDYKAYFLLFE
jgi:hypothetical protein